MLWQFVITVLVVWVVRRRWQMRRQLALARKLNTNLKTWPILGHAYMFLGSDEEKMKALQDFARDSTEMGGISKCLYFDQLFVCVADPAVAQLLMNQCLDKHELMTVVFQFVVGNSSLIAPEPLWQPRRKVTASALVQRNVAQFVDIFSEHSTAMVDLLEREVDKDEFSLWEYLSEYTMNTICETTVDVKMNFKYRKFINAVQELFRIGVYIMLRPWFCSKLMLRLTPGLNIMFKHIHTVRNFLTNIIIEKRAETVRQTGSNASYLHDNKYVPKTTFLGRQLEAPENKRLLDEELLEECITLVIAGFDTTANTIGFTVLMLAAYPDVQDKVYEELQEVFGDSDRTATYEDLSRLMYLEAVIKETLRLYPIIPLLLRHVNKDVELPSGMTVVKGCGVLINIWAIHRNPLYWGADVDQFRPERFLDDTPRHPAAFMPFSYGLRNCVGYRYAMLSMKSVVSTLLRRYRVLAPRGVPPGTLPGVKYDMRLKPVDNYQIRIQRRK